MAGFTDRLKTVYKRHGESYAAIGLADYPIFEEKYRPVLNRKILEHFWNEEVGFESSSMFAQAMRSRMNVIMPYYNQLYKTSLEALDMGDILTDVDMKTTAESTSVTSAESRGTSSQDAETSANDESSTNSTARALNYTYPQQQLNSDGRYATSGSDSESTGHSEAANSSTQSASGENESESTSDNYAMND